MNCTGKHSHADKRRGNSCVQNASACGSIVAVRNPRNHTVLQACAQAGTGPDSPAAAHCLRTAGRGQTPRHIPLRRRTNHSGACQCCGAEHATEYAGGEVVATGTRLLFNETDASFGRMAAAALLSYHLPISLATASARDLELIPGIGPKTARALIDYREQAGPIQRMEQLLEVRGIGPKTLEKITLYLRP